MECRKLCSYLVEIESKEEADWISRTFLEKGAFVICKFFARKKNNFAFLNNFDTQLCLYFVDRG